MSVKLCRALAVFVAVVGLTPARAHAQDSHCGAEDSFTPPRSAHEAFRDALLFEGDGPIEGTEFAIGIVRGSTLGGDWGVSFVQKPFEDGIGSSRFDQNCFSGICTSTSFVREMRDVRLRGVEFHWFRPFVTIKERVQIGINVAGGVAKPQGTILETITFTTTFSLPQPRTESMTDSFASPAKDVLQPIQPLGKLEAAGAIILAPGFKIKVAGGLNYPSVATFRIGGTVLFGR